MSNALRWLDDLDRSLFIHINQCHHSTLDEVMWYVSKMQTWIPVYVFLLVVLYRRIGLKPFIIAVFLLSLLLFITDFVAVHCIKNTVMRLRPSHDPLLKELVHLVADSNGNLYRGGQYGFFSNHSSNYFGVGVFFTLLMQPLKRRYVVALFSWIGIIVYSRIYLGVHYPGDIIAGALYGSFVAWGMCCIYQFLTKKWIK